MSATARRRGDPPCKHLGSFSLRGGAEMPAAARPPLFLVGEQNPYGGDDYFALYPAPDGCSGHRLCCNILGMRRTDYLRTFKRTNLCLGPWRRQAAVARAIELLRGGGRFVLFGQKVCDAFGVLFQPFTVADEILLRLPHPSGRNRIWSESGVIERTREAVRRFAPDVAHLIGRSDEE